MHAFSRALDWAYEEGMSIRGLLSLDEVEQMQRVFANQRAWSFSLYEALRAFSHAFPRLGLPDAPASIHLGDALYALNRVILRDAQGAAGTEPYLAGLAKHVWPTQSVPSLQTFAELGYSSTSSGISRLQKQHRSAWLEHARQSKALLLRAAELCPGTTAALVGAGKLYDIPLRELAERYERLILIDVDADSLAQSVELGLASPELRKRLVLVTSDVTGINEAFLLAARELFDQGLAEQTVYTSLLSLLYSYRLAQPPNLLPAEALGTAPLDTIFSVMVLSQLATPLTQYLERRFAERFPGSTLLQAHEFQVALGQFTHRIQDHHLQALLRHSRNAVVTSDVSEHYTQLATASAPAAVSAELPLIGAPHIEDLFPASRARVLASEEWQWRRVVPGPRKPRGRTLQVNGVIVQAVLTD